MGEHGPGTVPMYSGPMYSPDIGPSPPLQLPAVSNVVLVSKVSWVSLRVLASFLSSEQVD